MTTMSPVPAGGDPVVGSVGPIRDHHTLDQRPQRQPHVGVGHEVHCQSMPLSHPDRLVLHGAGVGVDVDRSGHGQSLPSPARDREEWDGPSLSLALISNLRLFQQSIK